MSLKDWGEFARLSVAVVLIAVVFAFTIYTMVFSVNHEMHSSNPELGPEYRLHLDR